MVDENARSGWRLEIPRAPREAWALARENAWRHIPAPLLAGANDPEDYEPDQSLLDAANVAIELGQPLLLTGEPGCGKTSFADHVAWQLGLGRALRHQVRADMEGRDLFYRYDNLARFGAAREGSPFDPEDFLMLSALGEAIVRASDPEIFGELRERLLPGITGERVRSVVLIDEIDKAPRDVPNDLLGYLGGERLWFELPDLGGRGADRRQISAASDVQPIVICTSNSEKALPDAFLRRCVFYNIEFPMEKLTKIIQQRVTGVAESSPLAHSVAEMIGDIRELDLRKKPGLAEVLAFVMALKNQGYGENHRVGRDQPVWQIARATLLKQREDQLETMHLFDVEAD